MKRFVLALVELRMLAFLFLYATIGVLVKRRSVDDGQVFFVGLRDDHLRELNRLEADGVGRPALEIGEEILDELVESMFVLVRNEVLLFGDLNHAIHCLAELLALNAYIGTVVDCGMLAVFFRRRSEFF